jgi:predicted peptidase
MSNPTARKFRRNLWDVRLIAAGLILLGGGVIYWAWGESRGFCRRVCVDANGDEFPYQVFVPHHYTADRSWPLILFLHGSGQSGTDGEAPVAAGLGAAIRCREQSFPFLAVFPQSAEQTWDAASADGQRVMAILDEICREFTIDPDRVYLTGMSMGGGGVWSLAATYPERWGSIAPVCGYGDPAWAGRFADIPCWCFHGALDNVIPVEQSRAMIRALREAGGQPRYTEYPDVRHDSWKPAYANDELYEWFLRQRRPRR